VLWLSGNGERALIEADSSIEWESFDAVKYLSAATLLIEIPQAFWAIVLFYTRMGKLEKAEKVYEMFSAVCKLYGQDLTSTLPSPSTMVAAAVYMSDQSLSPTDPSSLSPTTSAGLSAYNYTNAGAMYTNKGAHSSIINIPFMNYPTTATTTTPTTISSPSMFYTPSSPTTTTSSPQTRTTDNNNTSPYYVTSDQLNDDATFAQLLNSAYDDDVSKFFFHHQLHRYNNNNNHPKMMTMCFWNGC